MGNDNPLEKKRTSYGFRAIVLALFIVVAFLIATDVMSRRERSPDLAEEPRVIREYTVDDLATPWEDWRDWRYVTKEQIISPEVQRILDDRNLSRETETTWALSTPSGRDLTDFILEAPGPDNAAMEEVIKQLCKLPRETKVGIRFVDEKIPRAYGGYHITRQFKRFYFPSTYMPKNQEGCTYEGLAFEDITRDEYYGTYSSEVIRLESYFGEESSDDVWFDLWLHTSNAHVSSVIVTKSRKPRFYEIPLIAFGDRASNSSIKLETRYFLFFWELGATHD